MGPAVLQSQTLGCSWVPTGLSPPVLTLLKTWYLWMFICPNDVCLFHCGITNWFFDPLYTRSLSVKGLASQQVPILHCHGSRSHLSARTCSLHIANPFSILLRSFWLWILASRVLCSSHTAPICQRHKHNFYSWIGVINRIYECLQD